MFVHSKVNVTDKCPLTSMVLPLRSSSVDGWSHIPSPCGAALLPLPFGTGHETNIFSAFFYFSSFCVEEMLPRRKSFIKYTIFRD
ncbi:hypothetical protein Patl1_22852 [Pistacia atlantica]|uniref:Uncharacterized protein n=1 Tax=Pistacia atlantica TaxID=434234 RepID=A0ACC1A2A9_9ROSI|nr:hypothetical protein Patl1_22852 [Pistacia atlantica]